MQPDPDERFLLAATSVKKLMQSVSGNFREQFWMAEQVGQGGYGSNSDRRPSASIEAPNTIVFAVAHPVLALFVHFLGEMAEDRQLHIEFQSNSLSVLAVAQMIMPGLKLIQTGWEQFPAKRRKAALDRLLQTHLALLA